MKPVAYACSNPEYVNHLMSVRQFENCLSKNRAKFDVPLYAIPPTHAVVPIEPTQAMIDAAYKALEAASISDDEEFTDIQLYKAMIEAAQKEMS